MDKNEEKKTKIHGYFRGITHEILIGATNSTLVVPRRARPHDGLDKKRAERRLRLLDGPHGRLLNRAAQPRSRVHDATYPRKWMRRNMFETNGVNPTVPWLMAFGLVGDIVIEW